MAEEHLVAVDAGVINADERASIREALAAPCPCDGCVLRDRCRVERLACSAFVEFVRGRSWQRAKRAPTAALYEVAMADAA